MQQGGHPCWVHSDLPGVEVTPLGCFSLWWEVGSSGFQRCTFPFKMYFFLFYGNDCLPACLCTHVCWCGGCQKRVSHPLEMQLLQRTVSHWAIVSSGNWTRVLCKAASVFTSEPTLQPRLLYGFSQKETVLFIPSSTAVRRPLLLRTLQSRDVWGATLLPL